MPDDKDIVAECLRALRAARPFVIDGRPQDKASEVLTLLDAAIGLAANHGPPEPANDD